MYHNYFRTRSSEEKNITFIWQRKKLEGREIERFSYVHAEAGVKVGSSVFSSVASLPPNVQSGSDPKRVLRRVG